MKSIYRGSLTCFLCIQTSYILADESIESDTSRPDISVVEDIIRGGKAIIGFSWVDQPINKIVLIKSGDAFCAIKYLSYSRGNDKKEATAFNSGEESFYGEADLFTDADRSVIRLKLNTLPSTGLARFIIINHDNDRIKCGRARLSWQYPTATFFFTDTANVSAAVARSEKFDEIDFHDPSIKWFKYEGERKMQLVDLTGRY